MNAQQYRRIIAVNWLLAGIAAFGTFLAVYHVRQLRPEGADVPPVAAVAKTVPRPVTRADDQVGALTIFVDLKSKNLLRIVGTGPNVSMPFETMGRAAFEGQFAAVSVDPTGRLHPRFGELFGLDEATVAVLQQALVRAKTTMDEQVAAGAKVEVRAREVVITMPANQFAPAARETALQAFKSVLGPGTYDLWAALVSDEAAGPETLFQSVRESGMTYSIRPVPIPRGGDDGRRRYIVSGQGRGGSVSSSGLTREGLLTMIGPAAKGLPADF